MRARRGGRRRGLRRRAPRRRPTRPHLRRARLRRPRRGRRRQRRPDAGRVQLGRRRSLARRSTIDSTARPRGRDSRSATFVFSADGRDLRSSARSTPRDVLARAPRRRRTTACRSACTRSRSAWSCPEAPAEPPITTYEWTVVELDPPETTIVFGPAEPERSARPRRFAFESDEPAATFECSLDGAAVHRLPGPVRVHRPGRRRSTRSRVRAVDAVRERRRDAGELHLDGRRRPDGAGDDDPLRPGRRRRRSLDASFSFVADEPGSTFECSLDAEPFADCTSPVEFSVDARRPHVPRPRHRPERATSRRRRRATRGRSSLDTTRRRRRCTRGRRPRRRTPTRRSASPSNELGASSSARSTASRSRGCDTPMEYTELAAGRAHLPGARGRPGRADAERRPTPESYTWTIEGAPDTTPPETRILSGAARPDAAIDRVVHLRRRGRRDLRVLARRRAVRGVRVAGRVRGGARRARLPRSGRPTSPATSRRRRPATAGRSWRRPRRRSSPAPADRARRDSATFTFSSDQTGVEFFCSLDGLGRTLCTLAEDLQRPDRRRAHVRGRRAERARRRRRDAGRATPGRSPCRRTRRSSSGRRARPRRRARRSPSTPTRSTRPSSARSTARRSPTASRRPIVQPAWRSARTPSRSAPSTPRATSTRRRQPTAGRSPTATPPETTITGSRRTRARSRRRASASPAATTSTAAAQLQYECRFDSDTGLQRLHEPEDVLRPGAGRSVLVRRARGRRAGNLDPTPATYTWSIVAPTCTRSRRWARTRTRGSRTRTAREQLRHGLGPQGDDEDLENTRALVRSRAERPGGLRAPVRDAPPLRGARQGRPDDPGPPVAAELDGERRQLEQPAGHDRRTVATISGQGHRQWNVTAQVGAQARAPSSSATRPRTAAAKSRSSTAARSPTTSRRSCTATRRLRTRLRTAVRSRRSAPTRDAWVDQAARRQQGRRLGLRIMSKGPANNARALVKFSLPALPVGLRRRVGDPAPAPGVDHHRARARSPADHAAAGPKAA